MQMVMNKLETPFLQLFQDRYNLKDNIRKLQQSGPMIQALLEDAQKQQETRQAVKQWLMKLEDAAFGSEVLLDELAAEMKASERRTRKGKVVAGLTFFPGDPSRLFELASVLKKKLEELDQIVEEAFSFNLQEKALAVKAVANLLKSKKEDYWMSVQDSELWQFKAYQNEVMPVLKMSYQFLDTHLKRCLAFCSLFPKNHEIPREKMIYTWMAHGLISPDGGTMQLEVIGGEYFDDLLSLSFFQEVQKHDDGCKTVYKMHDLIHDLVRTVGGHGFSVLSHGLASSELERIHHLSIICNFDPSSLPEGLFGAKHLRTLLLLSPGGSSSELTPFWP